MIFYFILLKRLVQVIRTYNQLSVYFSIPIKCILPLGLQESRIWYLTYNKIV